MASLQLQIQKRFIYEDLPKQKESKLKEIRKELLSIAKEEKNRNLKTLKTQSITEKEKMKSSISQSKREILKRLKSKSVETAANKKISFHLQQPSNITLVKVN